MILRYYNSHPFSFTDLNREEGRKKRREEGREGRKEGRREGR
jgi:hypothetical protein